MIWKYNSCNSTATVVLITVTIFFQGTEALRIPLDATTGAIRTLVQYLYTDSVGIDDVTEELIALSEKYKLQQLRDFCMPTFIEKINTGNCLKMYTYGYKHQFEEVRINFIWQGTFELFLSYVIYCVSKE